MWTTGVLPCWWAFTQYAAAISRSRNAALDFRAYAKRSSISASASSFRAAGLGLRLDGTEDDYVWSTASEYEKVLKTQREKTLDHEAKAAAVGSAS